MPQLRRRLAIESYRFPYSTDEDAQLPVHVTMAPNINPRNAAKSMAVQSELTSDLLPYVSFPIIRVQQIPIKMLTRDQSESVRGQYLIGRCQLFCRQVCCDAKKQIH